MEHLFELKNNKIVITPIVLLIPEFNAIWERDKSQEKERAKKDIAYIYFLCDYASIYNSYPLEVRVSKVSEDLMGKRNYRPDELIQKAIERYNEFQNTPAVTSLKSVRKNMETTTSVLSAIQKEIKENMETYINNPGKDKEDLMEKTLKNLEKIQKIINQYPSTIKMLSELEEQVKKEIATGGGIRAGGEVGDYETAESINMK